MLLFTTAALLANRREEGPIGAVMMVGAVATMLHCVAMRANASCNRRLGPRLADRARFDPSAIA